MDKVTKVAVFLMSLEEEQMFEILKHLEEDEIQKIALSMVKLKDIRISDVLNVNMEFLKLYNLPFAKVPHRGTILEILKLASKNNEQAQQIIKNITTMEEARKKISIAEIIDSHVIMENFRKEHPQIFAFLISLLPKEKTRQILTKLPLDQKVDILMRIVNMESISPEIVKEATDSLIDNMRLLEIATTEKVGGVSKAVELLRMVGRDVWKVLETIRSQNEELADFLEKELVSFDIFPYLSDKVIQQLIINVDRNTLIIALKGASPEVLNKFLSNLPKNLRETFKEELEYTLPSITDIEQAKEKLVDTLRNLIKEGKASLELQDTEV